jgi:hypothetical protein
MTDKELADQAEYHFRRTTISYPEWVKRKNAGRYVPADGSGTEWGKAFAALDQIGTVVEPPPPPPPPTGFASPLGFLSNRSPGYFPASNIDKYGVISAEGPAPAAFRGVNIVYRSAISCGVGYTNMTESECVSNGWAMLGTDGQIMRNMSYGGVALGDPGLSAYRNRWFQLSLAYAQQHQSDSFWVDDATPRVADFNNNIWPQKYPNMAAYQAVLVTFMQDIKAKCLANGLVAPAYNSAVSSDDDASQTAAWWAQAGPHVGYMTAEYWETVGANVRRMGAEWYNHWDGWRALHGVCNQAGCGFLPFPSTAGQVYTLATFLLDWQATKGAVMWTPNDQYNTTTDPWVAQYDTAARISAPLGAATISGNVWTRMFAPKTGANITVTVDPVAGTASIL